MFLSQCVEDAELMLSERDIDFLMFHNAETGSINVIHTNSANSMELIEPRSEH